MVIWTSVVMAARPATDLLLAPKIPTGIEITTTITREIRDRTALVPSRPPTREATPVPVYWYDVPKSPQTAPVSQLQYWTSTGRSSPISARSAAIRSGVAFCPSLAMEASAGRMENARNTTMEISSRAMISVKNFLPIYLIYQSINLTTDISCAEIG